MRPMVERVIERAKRDAVGLRHDYVGSEHLVLAVLLLADPMLLELAASVRKSTNEAAVNRVMRSCPANRPADQPFPVA
jgi:hypothetical protein